MFNDSAVTAHVAQLQSKKPCGKAMAVLPWPSKTLPLLVKSNLSRKTLLSCGWSVASPCELPLCLNKTNSARYKDHLDGQLITILRSTMWVPPSSQVCPVCCACGPCCACVGGSQINSWAALPVLTTSASGSGVNILPKKKPHKSDQG